MPEQPPLFTAVIEQMGGSPQMETEYWTEVTDLDQATRIAQRLGFPGVEGDGIGGWLVEVAAEDQVQAITEGGHLTVGGNSPDIPFRIRFEMS